MTERLQKIIASRGYCSRRKAEEYIANGDVKVNGKIVKELGCSFESDCKIEIKGRELQSSNEKIYLLFNKPRAVITTLSDPKGRKTVGDFFKNYPTRLFPVGRLDYDVSGLLIMTNDGELANVIMHPRYGFSKTYQALCDGKVSKNQVRSLVSGVTILDDYFTKALDARIVNYDPKTDESVIVLTILEGKKHHVKEMLIAADIFLKKLKRTHIEFLNDENLKVGAYRPLKVHEVKQLYGLYKSKIKKEGN